MRSRGDMMKSSLLVALCVLLASGCGGSPTADSEKGGDPQSGGLEGAPNDEGSVDPASGEGSGEGAGRDKVTVCHIPPGNPANAHTITVGAPAVKAHLKHGDTLGACGSAQDGGSAPDAGAEPDAGCGEPDAGSPPDAGGAQDAGSPVDAGVCLPMDSDCSPGGTACCQGLSCSSAGVCEPIIG